MSRSESDIPLADDGDDPSTIVCSSQVKPANSLPRPHQNGKKNFFFS